MPKCKILLKVYTNASIVIERKQKFNFIKKCSFQCVSEATVRKAVKIFSSDKATAGEIPVTGLKIMKFSFLN